MIKKMFASVAAAETLIAAAIVAVGSAMMGDLGLGLFTFGVLWYTPVLIDRIRGVA